MLTKNFNTLVFVILFFFSQQELLSQEGYEIINDSSYIFNIHPNLPSLIGKFSIFEAKEDNDPTNIYRISLYDLKDSSLSQEIIDTSDYFNFNADIIFSDFNFDSFKDISLVVFRDTRGQALYDYWIFNPQTNLYELNYEFSGLLDCYVTLDSLTKTIISECRGGCGGLCFHNSIYKVEKNKLLLIEENFTEQEIFDDRSRIKVITKKMIGGKMQITDIQFIDEE
ncbi:MAG: hypothetical protein B6D44_00615 [Ignavibacteriales bacterium UTCHB2]|jgi:hypothetical protein|nr:MAG: hypothetical protein B6D44_00615 [Ignavibacteriales bacterium UTCHB2]